MAEDAEYILETISNELVNSAIQGEAERGCTSFEPSASAVRPCGARHVIRKQGLSCDVTYQARCQRCLGSDEIRGVKTLANDL